MKGIQAAAAPGMPLLFDEDGIDQPFPMPAGEPGGALGSPWITICAGLVYLVWERMSDLRRSCMGEDFCPF